MNRQKKPAIRPLNEPISYLSLSIEEMEKRLEAELLEERLEMGCVLVCNGYCFLP
jgi:hypothetical protein